MKQRFDDMELQPGDLVVFHPGHETWRPGTNVAGRNNKDWECTPLVFVGVDYSSWRMLYRFLHWSGRMHKFDDIGPWDCEVLSRVAEALG